MSDVMLVPEVVMTMFHVHAGSMVKIIPNGRMEVVTAKLSSCKTFFDTQVLRMDTDPSGVEFVWAAIPDGASVTIVPSAFSVAVTRPKDHVVIIAVRLRDLYMVDLRRLRIG